MKKVNSLGFKIPFVICSIVVLIIIVMLISSVNIASSGISKSRLGGFNSTIAGYASVLDTWFDLQTSIISTYSVTPTVVKYLENDVNFTEELLSETINKFKDNNLYLINFGIADSEGDIFLDSMSSSALGKNLKDYIPDAWNRFVASNTDGVVYADKLVQSEITSKWAMPAIKPVKDSYNITIGYIYIFLDWYMLHQTHFADIDLGKTGGLFITTDKLYNIMDSLYENIAVMKINPIYEEAFKSGNISGNLTYNLDGQKRTAAYHKLKNQPWIIALAMMNYEIYEQNMKLIIAISIIGIISIVILAILVNLFIRTITKPLEIVVEEASKIEQGDLSHSEQRIKSRKDEIGTLSKSFVSMRNKLIETITEVNEASNNIVNAAKELSSSNTDLSRRTESQAASLEETASSMEEMASTIKSSTDYAITGNNMMVSSKEAIESAGSIITETTKNIEEVFEASTKIKNITKIIEDIAFQTNI
ncbi:methyl-accepting chemotaxis protein, partial [Brachyspira pilosicoli]|uniref:methyl-accepting chemotaxis protein n=1 Tax=Brachyspira pilosicoli TaxID=52584 RepID=UPI001CA555F4